MITESNNWQSSKKIKKKTIVQVLLPGGSDGDLIFYKKVATKQFPYLTRQVPKIWHTLNGDFQTKGGGSIQLNFFQYSLREWAKIHPNVVEYDGEKVERPMFDLILGTKTMKDLGIILNFQKADDYHR